MFWSLLFSHFSVIFLILIMIENVKTFYISIAFYHFKNNF